MTTFTARVELQSAGQADYQRLRAEMEKETFTSATRAADSGNVAFKSKEKTSITEATDAVLRAASKTGKKFTFTVMKDKQIDKSETRARYAAKQEA